MDIFYFVSVKLRSGLSNLNLYLTYLTVCYLSSQFGRQYLTIPHLMVHGIICSWVMHCVPLQFFTAISTILRYPHTPFFLHQLASCYYDPEIFIMPQYSLGLPHCLCSFFFHKILKIFLKHIISIIFSSLCLLYYYRLYLHDVFWLCQGFLCHLAIVESPANKLKIVRLL